MWCCRRRGSPSEPLGFSRTLLPPVGIPASGRGLLLGLGGREHLRERLQTVDFSTRLRGSPRPWEILTGFELKSRPPDTTSGQHRVQAERVQIERSVLLRHRLYGTIKVVSGRHLSDYATGAELIRQGAFPGSSELGLSPESWSIRPRATSTAGCSMTAPPNGPHYQRWSAFRWRRRTHRVEPDHDPSACRAKHRAIR